MGRAAGGKGAAPQNGAQAVWKQDTVEGLDKGSRVWYKASADSWLQGTLASAAVGECQLALDSARGPGTGEVIKVPASALVPANPAVLDGVADLTALSYLNEPSILHDLQQRYIAPGSAIYTHAGPVLIAVNPFKKVALYTPEIVGHYKARTNDASEGYDPHVFLTADKAFKAMCKAGKSQSLIISGESGAGKTETTKIAMQYLAGLAGGTGVEDQVLQTNPLLEAFGNAKTLRNNNSSRFGKLIEIYFNNQRHICGALIHTYLLEKSRVVHQLAGERSFHIFYQLCQGTSAAERARWRLPAAPLQSFNYLMHSGCTAIDGVDDGADFLQVKKAMKAVGIGEEDQDKVFQLLAAILWLGNINYDVQANDSVLVRKEEALTNAAALLAVAEADLACVLSTRKIMAGGETISTQLKLESAVETRDALAKAMYAALFKWLVERINATLAVGKRRSELSMAILDIYGFECFKTNSFEQLCINYANERLQQQFNKHLFKLEQEAYESEGIDWAHVEFEDNQECLDLIENRPPRAPGILSLLDEECLFPKATDSTFGQKLRENLAQNKRFGFNPRLPTDDFTIEHYAGAVQYSCTKFLDKNRDTLSPDLLGLMTGSGEALLRLLAEEVARSQERRGSSTVGARFRDQLKDLISRLDQTELHFVRCIKPNNMQVADEFSAALVLHQLRCCGVLEVTRIARAGYPTRYAHSAFADRFHVLLHGPARRRLEAGAPALEVCRLLLDQFRVPGEMYQIGRTKLFFRAGVLGLLEDTWARILRSTLTIQSTWRMLVVRRAFLRARRAAVTIQARGRGIAARVRFAELKRRHHAALAVQSAHRGHKARLLAKKRRRAVSEIQAGYRRMKVNQRVAERLRLRRVREAEEAARQAARRREEEAFEAIKAEFGMDNGGIRQVLALWQQHGPALVEWQQHRPEYLAWKEAGAPSAAAARELPQPTPVRVPSVRVAQLAAARAPGVDEPSQTDVSGADVASRRASRAGDSSLPSVRSEIAATISEMSEALEPLEPSGAAAAASAALRSSQDGSEAASVRAAVSPPSASPNGNTADVAWATEQIAMWEEYAGKLEEQVRMLIDDQMVLQKALTSVRQMLTDEQAAQLPVADWYKAMNGTDLGSAGEISPTSQAGSVAPGDALPLDDVPVSTAGGAGSGREAAASGQRYVSKLAQELSRKQALFDDDVEFIKEVKLGMTDAPGMNPDHELKTLRLRFDAFKRDFKVRLSDTEHILKKIEKESRRTTDQGLRKLPGNTPPLPPSDSKQRLPAAGALGISPSPGPGLDDMDKKKKGIMQRLSFKSKTAAQRSAAQ